MNRLICIFILAFSLIVNVGFGQTGNVGCKSSKKYSSNNNENQTYRWVADNSRSDSIDIINYSIHLDFTNFIGKRIKGFCTVRFAPKINGVDYINLDIEQLVVDSVQWNGNNLAFNRVGTLLNIPLPTALNTTDTTEVTVFYQGLPPTDASGFGGFHFENVYAYNLGVGFSADPHNYGRAWYPCFDNFVERATYDFHIISHGGRKGFCNGILTNEINLGGDTLMRSWEMNDPIPSYLACVAVSSYETVHMNHSGLNGNIPISLVALANDTTNLKNSFINLGEAIDAFEYWYGPHQWDKIGYVLTTVGAMEHPTCIAYPASIANGNLTYEDIMAHELGHHWWGNLATCQTAEDMWINEGMASFSEHLFLEWAYDRATYIEEVKNNHSNVMQYAHIEDEQYWAVSGIPHNLTYGTHVYDKGAVVGHSLRGYLGDTMFRTACQSIMNDFKFKDISSADMRDHITNVTGIDMNPFFDDWIFSPGFSHFAIDSFQTVFNGTDYEVTLFVRQRLKGATNFHTNVPFELSMVSADRTFHRTMIEASGELTTINVNCPFEPVMSFLNENNLINQARLDDLIEITDPLSKTLRFGKMQIFVNEVPDTTLFRAAHHWVAPDTIRNNPNNLRISNYHHWTIDGIIPEGFKATARFYFDGRTAIGGGNGYLDTDLVSVREDSIYLLYKANHAEDWAIYPHYTRNHLGSAFNRYGAMILDTIMLGHYAFANGGMLTGISEVTKEPEFQVFPNPTHDYLQVKATSYTNEPLQIQLTDLSGKAVLKKMIPLNESQFQLDVSNFSNGIYFLSVWSSGVYMGTRKVILLP